MFLFCIFINSEFAVADQCPSPEVIKERNISRDYEWTMDERRSLEDVLSVEKLYSVRIKNKGEFVACSYSASNKLLRLDAAAIEKGCTIRKKLGNWAFSKKGEHVCKEDDLSLCHYEVHCEATEGNDD